MSSYEDIELESEQIELLMYLVESRRTSQGQRGKFFISSTFTGGYMLFTPADKGTHRSVFDGDIEILAHEGLIYITERRSGDIEFNITPQGIRYYKYLKTETGDAINQVETELRTFIDSTHFSERYPVAYQKWSNAAQRLWYSESVSELTTIGHLCRECLQEFVDVIVRRHQPPESLSDKAKTVARLKFLFGIKKDELGNTHIAFLEALVAYWGTVSDLVQRQEHGAQKEGEPLSWEDARRVVFQTLVVMYEIDRAL